VKVNVNLEQALVADVNDRKLNFTNAALQFGPYYKPPTADDQAQLNQMQRSADNLFQNSFTDFLRGIAFFPYFITMIQVDFNFLLVNAVYPQNFYEITRIFSALYVPDLPRWEELNEHYNYQVFHSPKDDTELIAPVRNPRLHSVGFTGYFLVDFGRQLLFMFLLGVVSLHGLRLAYEHFKPQIERGEKTYVKKAYLVLIDVTTNVYEAWFGVFVYSLLAEYQGMTFSNALGVFSFLFTIVVVTYFLICVYKAQCRILRATEQNAQQSQHVSTLLKRLDLYREGQSPLKKQLLQYLWLIGYAKKAFIMLCIFLGYKSSDFQLVIILLMTIAHTALIVYLKPYSSKLHLGVKVFAETIIVLVTIILLAVTNKMKSLSEQYVISEEDANKVWSQGLAAGGLLILANIVYFLLVIVEKVISMYWVIKNPVEVSKRRHAEHEESSKSSVDYDSNPYQISEADKAIPRDAVVRADMRHSGDYMDSKSGRAEDSSNIDLSGDTNRIEKPLRATYVNDRDDRDIG
jgi:hypothetical protein